jgi:cytolysin (calcineurin-like family phosphatase)
VVVNLAIEGQNAAAIFRLHRLVAAFKVDNLEAHRTQTNVRGLIDPVLIWPAMMQARYSAADNTRRSFIVDMGKPCNSAHVSRR